MIKKEVQMNKSEMLTSLMASEKLKTWIPKPEKVRFTVITERNIVFGHIIYDKKKHYLYVFILFSNNNWQVSVDVSEGTADEVIDRIFTRIND